MKVIRFGLVLAVVLLTSVGANAADIYKDEYTTETSAGAWTFTGTVTNSGAVTNSGGITYSGYVKPNISIISATPATLTTSDSGKTFIIDDASDVYSTIVTITLPPASTTTAKCEYTFQSGDGSGIVLRLHPDAKDNRWQWYNDVGAPYDPSTVKQQARITRADAGASTTPQAPTGVTVKLRMGANKWYVECASATTIDMETWSANI